jgi:GNAT superfamily N-acetyltransferase
MAFEIKPLLEADTLSLVRVHYRAFNRAAGTFFFNREPSESSYQLMAAQRVKTIAKSNMDAYQAIDSSGNMIGAAIFRLEPNGISQEKLDNPEPNFTEWAPEQNADLWKAFGFIMQKRYAEHVGTRPAVEVMMLLVDPSWQGKGVGGALLDIGVKEADRIGCLTYVDASDEGLRVYEKAGFKEVGRIGFDISVYGHTGRCPVDTVMIREARPA